MAFLSEKSLCGKTLLGIVSRGNANIAELLRLADYIPPVFRLIGNDKIKYSGIIMDFEYFRKNEYYENQILSNIDLQELDEEFRDNHAEILTRFYKAFESILKYVNDFNRFLEDLEQGVFIQQTLEAVLKDMDGKQLLAEAVYLYGVMLLVADLKIEGVLRERLIVSYHRYCGSEAEQANIDEVVKLLRSTGFSKSPTAKRPADYPEGYFARIPINKTFLKMLATRLHSDDIYNQIAIFPSPEHRSTALATQAAMLFVVLYFLPETLHTGTARMREIVDKHFPDNWTINMYMGITVELAEAWEPYKAASIALKNTLEPSNVKEQLDFHIAQVPKLIKEIQSYNKEGVLTDDFIMDNLPRLMNCLRNSNVTIRWLMLHSHLDPRLELHKKTMPVRNSIVAALRPDLLFNLLLTLSQFEARLREQFKLLLGSKQARWDMVRHEASDRMRELSDVFGGATPLSRVEKNETLQQYFLTLSTQIAAIDYTDSTSAGRKITHLQSALEEVQEFHQLDNSLQIRQFIAETCLSLKQMLRTINIKEDVLIAMQTIGDISYAWEIIDNYTKFMQAGVKQNPWLVIKLRATFQKLSSALELPLLRILQSNSEDLESVSDYYSSELVAYVRKVLQIIPESMFELLAQIIAIQTNTLQEVPTRLEKERLKDFAQLEARYDIASKTNDIAVFTEGILMMKSTSMGSIKVDPKKLLEDGIRKELVRQVAEALHNTLIFPPNAKQPELIPRLTALSSKMEGFRRSFEYIQDYVGIYGIKMLQEETSRIINYNVEQECNSFLRTKIHDWMSQYQSKSIPIPQFPRVDESVNFIGRLASEILKITDCQSTVYIEQMTTWYDAKTRREVLSSRLFTLLQKALGTYGLAALDKLYSFMIVKQLQIFETFFVRGILSSKNNVDYLRATQEILGSLTEFPSDPKTYEKVVQRVPKTWTKLSEVVMKIGQIQIIRRLIARELKSSCEYDSKMLSCALESFNLSLISDIEAHYQDPSKPYPGGDDDDGQLLAMTSKFLQSTGFHDPLAKIYVTSKKLDFFPLTLFVFCLTQIGKMTYEKSVESFLSRRVDDLLDGPAFICGVLTLLKQRHSTHTNHFLAFFGQFVRSLIGRGAEERAKVEPGLPVDAVNTMLFLEEFCLYASIDRKSIEVYIPPYIFDEYRGHA